MRLCGFRFINCFNLFLICLATSLKFKFDYPTFWCTFLFFENYFTIIYRTIMFHFYYLLEKLIFAKAYGFNFINTNQLFFRSIIIAQEKSELTDSISFDSQLGYLKQFPVKKQTYFLIDALKVQNISSSIILDVLRYLLKNIFRIQILRKITFIIILCANDGISQICELILI